MTIAIEPLHNFSYDGLRINIFYANKGEGVPKHEHLYTHATICISGSMIIRKEGKELVITKESGAFNLKENEWHELEALEDGTVFENIFKEGAY